MKEYRTVNFARLTFGITEDRGLNKLPYKWKKTFDTSVVGDTLDQVLELNPGFENKYHEKFGLIKKAKIKLINFKILHNQGKTTYKL